jgi:hypothetical protein
MRHGAPDGAPPFAFRGSESASLFLDEALAQLTQLMSVELLTQQTRPLLLVLEEGPARPAELQHVALRGH